jgi:hypothetical protein
MEVTKRMARIAVEDSLSGLKDKLKNNGHVVVAMQEGSMEDCQCVVITGQDKNMMGIANTVTEASVINAEGMTDEEILKQVNQRIQQ